MMLLRGLLIVSLIAAVLALGFGYWNWLVWLFEQAKALDKDTVEKIKTWQEILTGICEAIAALCGGVFVVFRFVLGKKEPPDAESGGHSTVFQGKVDIRGDFVQGDKHVQGD